MLKGTSVSGNIRKKNQQLSNHHAGGVTLFILSLTSHVFIMAPQHSMGTGSILERLADVCVEGTRHVNHGLGVFPRRA